ncbi:MAG TPA: hypothetical protein VME46_07330, partial [Acidimicrobiales bacterium]|nr:hypothetical protein [Acidimicrobiales bacterium]
LELLADDVVVWTDGGGKARAASRPIVGREQAARFLARAAQATPAGAHVLQVNLNHQPGLVALSNDVVLSAAVLDIAEGRVCGVRIVVNPDKLAALGRALARFSSDKDKEEPTG